MPPDESTIGRLARTRTVDLVTTGRRTGAPRRVEIWWFRFEDLFVITGTPGRRDWYANVVAEPRVLIETRFGNFPGTAVPVSDREFKRRFFTDGASRWYSTQAGLDLLVDTAPMIRVDLE